MIEPTKRSDLWQPLAIAGLSLLLLSGCFRAPFISYDDDLHIRIGLRTFGRESIWSLILRPHGFTYMPVTYFSYILDYQIFHGWMVPLFNGWAAGVRLMTWFYHACASLILWRLLLLIGIGRLEACFVALIFAIHPTACETVCWASERKNALAALFGFASLLAYIKYEGRAFRMPLTVLLYTLANMGKPSALGILPVIALIDLFGGRAGLLGQAPLQFRPNRSWVDIFERMVPLAAVSVFIIYMNIAGEAYFLVKPPGGTVVTAAMTDFDLLSRYSFNLLLPVGLSAAYYVDPILGPGDPRLWICGAALTALVAVTVWLAGNRRLALFGWLWFIGALGPSLNIIAISYPMQDRYIYLSLPGFFLAFSEALTGLAARMLSLNVKTFRTIAAAYVVFLCLLSIARSAVYEDAVYLFGDATVKQPLSGFAHYGLSSSYTRAWQILADTPGSDPQTIKELKSRADSERRMFLENCPDAERQVAYLPSVLEAGESAALDGDVATAERYFMQCANPAPHFMSIKHLRAAACRGLAQLLLQQTGRESEAYDFAQRAMELNAADLSRLVRAGAALAWAKTLGDVEQARKLKSQAREDLHSIPRESEIFARAQALKQKNFKE